MHGTFRTGVQKTKWGIDGIIKALYNLFPDSLANKEDYKKITGSKVFPLSFSGTRWIEDKKVADRALEIWPNIAKYVSETLKKARSQVPTSIYFATFRSAYRMIS